MTHLETQRRPLAKWGDARCRPVVLGDCPSLVRRLIHSGLCMFYHAAAGLSRGGPPDLQKLP
ncbi:hypothetical protein ATI53_1002148 [Salipiger aestuarii]|uniref:Uncharacterized protein n=1 Tax=Salipiger aestuarii TaxID=568098 RepID=A0A327YYI0_9RHOB|nr:hypothetical protein ATI53_1002148 [Salipiger aestuarii]